MLKEIYAENFTLIDKLRQGFDEGLNVISGETGAGKSVIVDAVGLLLGNRFEQQFIRNGAEKCLIEGVFSPPYSQEILNLLKNAGFDFIAEDEIVLSREANRSGKSTSRINYRSVNLGLLRELGRLLINIHGQAEHTLLLDESRQTALVDAFGGKDLLKQVRETAFSHELYSQCNNTLKQLEAQIQTASQNEDFMRFQIKELEDAQLESGEDDKLRTLLNKLAHGEKLLLFSSNAKEALYGSKGALTQLTTALKNLKQVVTLDESMNEFAIKLEELYFEVEDISLQLSDYANSVIFEPYRLEEVQNRLSELERLKKKYHLDVQGLCDYLQKIKQQLDTIDNAAELLAKTQQETETKHTVFLQHCQKLSITRALAARALEQEINKQLQELYMNDAKFAVHLVPGEPNANGAERVVFMLAANKGEPYCELAKTASGGELSRVILAIKVILAKQDAVPTLIFDEIDTGLGGGAISAVAKKLQVVSESAQVICVTHAAILAGRADTHIHIFKQVQDERTIIHTEKLDHKGRITELCRMLAGENAGDKTIAQAEEMLKL